MDAVVSKDGDFVLNVEGFENGDDVIIFVHPHQDVYSAVLVRLQSPNASARDPMRSAIQSSNLEETKVVDELLCIFHGSREKFRNVSKVVKRCLMEVHNVGVTSRSSTVTQLITGDERLPAVHQEQVTIRSRKLLCALFFGPVIFKSWN